MAESIRPSSECLFNKEARRAVHKIIPLLSCCAPIHHCVWAMTSPDPGHQAESARATPLLPSHLTMFLCMSRQKQLLSEQVLSCHRSGQPHLRLQTDDSCQQKQYITARSTADSFGRLPRTPRSWFCMEYVSSQYIQRLSETSGEHEIVSCTFLSMHLLHLISHHP